MGDLCERPFFLAQGGAKKDFCVQLRVRSARSTLHLAFAASNLVRHHVVGGLEEQKGQPDSVGRALWTASIPMQCAAGPAFRQQ